MKSKSINWYRITFFFSHHAFQKNSKLLFNFTKLLRNSTLNSKVKKKYGFATLSKTTTAFRGYVFLCGWSCPEKDSVLSPKKGCGYRKSSANVKIDLLLIWLHCRQLADSSATRLRPLNQWEVFLSNLRSLTGTSNRPTKVRRSALRVKHVIDLVFFFYLLQGICNNRSILHRTRSRTRSRFLSKS